MTTGGFNSKELLAVEDELTLSVLTNKEAVEIGECVIKIARERNLPIATRVYIGDWIAFHVSLPGSDAENDRWMARKVRTVAAKGHSSMCLRILAEEAGITEEVGKRYEKVAATQKRLSSGDADPSLMRQTYLRIGILPDPITMSEPSEPKHFLFPIMKARQWLASRGAKFIAQDKALKEQFLAEAEPIVKAYNDLRGAA